MSTKPCRLLGLCLLVLAVSCSGSSEQTAYASDRPVHDLFYVSKDGEIDNYLAQQAFVERCMKSEGWEFVPEPLSVSGIEEGFLSLETQRSLEYRRSFGLAYSPPQTSDAGELIYTENTAIYASLSETERELWLDQQDACFADAENNTRSVQFIEQLDSALQEEVLSVSSLTHRDLQAEVARWSDCMIDQGFQLGHPFEAYQYAADLYSDDDYDPESGVLQDDLAVAVADYECSQQLWAQVDGLIAQLEQQVSG